jgi:peptide/nickel transport system permease protein
VLDSVKAVRSIVTDAFGARPVSELPRPIADLERSARRQAIIAGSVLLVIAIAAIGAPWLAPFEPALQLDIVASKSLPPSLTHFFGTDPYSRDVLSRVMYGARVSLSVATLATVVAIVVGTTYGAIAGYIGGRLDSWMMRVVDALRATPRVLVLITIVALWPELPLGVLIVLLGMTGWFELSRLVRGQVLVLRQLDFVLAAEALGARRARVLRQHILPNVIPTIVVAATLGIGHVIALEAGLSYLGLGVRPPGASWGNIIQDGAEQMATAWWISLFPGLLIVAASIACNALGEALDTLLDPRRKGMA